MKVLGLNSWTLLVAALLVFAGVAGAQEPNAAMEVTKKQGQTWLAQNGQLEVLTTDVTFPQSIKVMTNGTFTVNEQAPRELQEGQRLRSDGWLVGADGSATPVFNHLTVQKGNVILFQDGESRPLTQIMTLSNGLRVRPDGFLMDRGGKSTRLIEGQRVLLNGNVLPAKDSITLKQGQVWVQKDGQLHRLQPRQTMMMNEGSKVVGDGTLIRRDGTREKLVEGNTVLIEGTELKLR